MGMSIESVKGLLNERKDTECVITECFKKHGENTYVVHNLEVEEEDGEIMFYDPDGIIENYEYSVLKYFLVDSMMDTPEIHDNIITIKFSEEEYITIKIS